MPLDDYKIRVADKRDVENGAKIEVELVEKESEKVVNSSVKGVDDRQLNKSKEYWEQKMTKWAERLYKDYKSDKKEIPVDEIEL